MDDCMIPAVFDKNRKSPSRKGLGSIVAVSGPLARFNHNSDSGSYSDEEPVVCSMDGLAASLPDTTPVPPSTVSTDIDAVVARTTMDVNRVTVRLNMIFEPIIPTWNFKPSWLDSAQEADVELLALLGAEDEWSSDMSDCNVALLYERLWLVATWADSPFGVPREDLSFVEMMQTINTNEWLTYLHLAYNDSTLTAFANAAELHRVLHSGASIPCLITAGQTALNDARAAVRPLIGAKRAADSSDDDGDADEPLVRSAPQTYTENDVHKAETLLRCTMEAGFGLVDRFTYTRLIAGNAELRDYLDLNGLCGHVDVLARFTAAQEAVVKGPPAEHVAIKVSKLVDALIATGRIRKVQDTPEESEGSATTGEIWPESASLYTHRPCGIVWPSPITRAEAKDVTVRIEEFVWKATLETCCSVLQELVIVQKVPAATIREISVSVRERDEDQAMHVERYRRVTSALGYLEDKTRRRKDGVRVCDVNGDCDSWHCMITFFVHLMAMALDDIREI